MKKTVKAPKKMKSQRTMSKNIKKKDVKTVKKAKKRQKITYSDTIRAFLLAGTLVIFSFCVSFAAIKIYSSIKNTGEIADGIYAELPLQITSEPSPPAETKPEQKPVFAEPVVNNPPPVLKTAKPVIPVSAQQTAQNKTREVRTVPERTARETQPLPSVKTTPASTVQKPPDRPFENTGTLVFIIDDAGNNLRELEPFLRIPGPLTIAVLPGLPYSAEAARRIRAAGKEVFLHQPMEAIGAQNPGPGAIYSGMDADEIRLVLKRNIEEVGPVAGINNHQGSKITMDREAVEIILAFCAENGLHFLDSRTTAETVIPSEARRMGIKIAQRDIFIDNEKDKESMIRSIKSGLDKARKNGSAVMIGHAWSPELAPLLAEQFPFLVRQGYIIRSASDIVKGN